MTALTAADPAAVLLRFLKAITRFDTEAVLALLAEDAVIEFPYAGKGFPASDRRPRRDRIVLRLGPRGVRLVAVA